MVPGAGCASTLANVFIGNTLTAIDLSRPGQFNPQSYGDVLYSTEPLLVGATSDALEIAGNCFLHEVPFLGQIISLVECGLSGAETIQQCGPVFRTIGERQLNVRVVTSVDPNAKYGPSGVGLGRFVRDGNALAYTIIFENDSAATAAAQRIVVTDRLDTLAVDPSTIRLGPIRFGSTILKPALGAAATPRVRICGRSCR